MDEKLYDPNSARNGIPLPKNKEFAAEVGLPVHSGPHDAYTLKVTNDVRAIDDMLQRNKISSSEALARIHSVEDKFRALIPKYPEKLGGW
ncbi:AHH domain-containing protein [Pandoraea apista]|uniref:AHH domain-containing protein n=1 Tax=Pandoraea apista TaxID=93218 RepID=UPI003449E5D5